MLSIPDSQWNRMLDEFARLPKDVERVAYLDGIRYVSATGEISGVVTTVVMPDAILTPGNYRVLADSMIEAGEHMFELGLVRLAQVHTHGNGWVEHSIVDDREAYTRRDGGISIVLPHHARRRPEPREGGVHVRKDGAWHRLDEASATRAVRLVPGLCDFRRLPAERSRWSWLPWNR